MIYRIENIKIREDIEKEKLLEGVCKKYRINKKDIISWHITKKSVDARDKNDIFYNYTIEIETQVVLKKLNEIKRENIEFKNICNKKIEIRPVIVGAGPAGLFCGLILAQNGIKPIIIEQGKRVLHIIETFTKTGSPEKKRLTRPGKRAILFRQSGC